MATEEMEREAFGKEWPRIQRAGDAHGWLGVAWEAWQARAARSAPAVPEGWVLVPADDPERSYADPLIPYEMVWAGTAAYEAAQADLANYKPGETPDWDAGMIVVAVYRAMLAARPQPPAAVAAAPEVPDDERIHRLMAAIEGELGGLFCGVHAAAEILAYVDTGLGPDERAAPQPPASPSVPVDEPDHLADLAARFSAALLEKLRAAEKKYGYGDAWMIDDWRGDLLAAMAKHVCKGDPRDVAAYCAFAWHHGWSVTPTTEAVSAEAGEDWRDDPAADERWNAGCDFAMVELCHVLKIDPTSITWDAATETVEGDVNSVLGRILEAGLGEGWQVGRIVLGEPVAWAVERWNEEVKNRPLNNVHRRALDTTWRQVIRHFCGDADTLVGPSHDDLAATSPSPSPSPSDREVPTPAQVRDEPVAWQRRWKYETAPGSLGMWEQCSHLEATGMFSRSPYHEYRPLYLRPSEAGGCALQKVGG